MTYTDYKKKIEEYCIERARKGVTPIFTVRWIIGWITAINNVPRENLPELRGVIRKLHQEGKIKKYGSKTWQWIGEK